MILLKSMGPEGFGERMGTGIESILLEFEFMHDTQILHHTIAIEFNRPPLSSIDVPSRLGSLDEYIGPTT